MIKEQNVERNLFEVLVPPADMVMDPELQDIDRILDEDPTLLQQVKEAFAQRHPHSRTLGRHSTAVEVVFRMLVLKHLYGWSYEETERNVRDSLVLRQFCRIYFEKVPDDTVLIRWNQCLPDNLLKEVNEKIVHLAQKRKVTRGRKLRVDTTVVETNIHYPTDSHLLADGVKVLGRIAQKVRKAGIATGEVVRDFTRSTKRRVLTIIKFAKAQGEVAEESFRRIYQELLAIVQQAVDNGKALKRTLVNRARHLGEEPIHLAKALKNQLDHYIPLIERVIEQATRRVIHGESVPNSEKLISIFQPHSYVIRKGKPHKPNEFGQVVKIQEADGGVITDYQRFNQPPSDSDLFLPAIEKHRELFGRPPHLAAGDRTFYSHINEEQAYEIGVKWVSLPKRGKKSKERQQLEKSRWFKAGQRFRAGSEGRISVLKRKRKFGRCLYNGEEGFDRWVGWVVITSNLKVMAHT